MRIAGAAGSRIALLSPYLVISTVGTCCRCCRSHIAPASPYLVMFTIGTCCRCFSRFCIAPASPYLVMSIVGTSCQCFSRSHIVLASPYLVQSSALLPALFSLSQCSSGALFGGVGTSRMTQSFWCLVSVSLFLDKLLSKHLSPHRWQDDGTSVRYCGIVVLHSVAVMILCPVTVEIYFSWVGGKRGLS